MALRSFRTGTPSAVAPLARSSTVDLIATELRIAIFTGALPVGSALREVEISSQLGVSRSPFREAAQRLVQEGLLTAVPGRGIRVATIPAEQLPDLYLERIAVEGQAVRVIAAVVDDAEHAARLAEIVQALRALERASTGGDAWEIGDADLAFHQTLVDAARSRRLSRAMVSLAYATRVASLSAFEGYSVRTSVSPTYDRLIAALRARDAERAVAELQRQFDDAIRRLTGADASVETIETATEDEPQEFGRLDTGAITL